ncbi:GNAT family N-acetyltransferase [Pseudomonas proteolytica]|uniref:GNAT family N-acetyltransferase n=1 Tax=Pseudomonas proteolytica TaxID=219574 RepID=UPI001964A2F4|nr:GNAT family N-acetyltransferase [Pseudomonas proteolytica]
MLEDIAFRNATMDDGVMLHRWRNDEATRAASHSTSEVDLEGHLRWLASTLENPSRTLLIAEIEGVPVGTVRADEDPKGTELSWTVAPEARGLGVAKRMVKAVMRLVSGPITAEVKKSNGASIAVAVFSGMTQENEVDGVIHFSGIGLRVID